MNILITSNTFYHLDYNNFRGGLEAVVIETFKLLRNVGHNVFPATNLDTVVPTELEENIFRYSFECGELVRAANPNKKRFLIRLGDDNAKRLRDFVIKNDIEYIIDNNTKPQMIREYLFLDIPVLHMVHNAIYGMEFFTYSAINELKKDYPNLKCAAVSQYITNKINTSIPGFIDYVLHPFIIGNNIPSIVTYNPDKINTDVLVSRIQKDYKIIDIVKLYGEAQLPLDIIGGYHTANDI